MIRVNTSRVCPTVTFLPLTETSVLSTFSWFFLYFFFFLIFIVGLTFCCSLPSALHCALSHPFCGLHTCRSEECLYQQLWYSVQHFFTATRRSSVAGPPLCCSGVTTFILFVLARAKPAVLEGHLYVCEDICFFPIVKDILW